MSTKTKRSGTIRTRFLSKRGLKRTPRGKEIDHKIPLHKGGSDSLRNLRLIKKSSHKTKTRKELRNK
ncbi:hypothetical protein AMJ49_06625 [Parcubacteria bacterium DG_74_2]|nr:MAG: hypothetical protein AMJ49_06625 [Parcubacteria bacterium DG_74_2]